MDVSKFLGKVIGIYLIILSISLFCGMNAFITYINSIINDMPLMFVTGFFTLIIGLLMVVSHNIWQWNWRVIITIISWITLFKGASIVLCPHFLDRATLLFTQNVSFAYGVTGFDFIIGVVLCYFAFKR